MKERVYKFLDRVAEICWSYVIGIILYITFTKETWTDDISILEFIGVTLFGGVILYLTFKFKVLDWARSKWK